MSDPVGALYEGFLGQVPNFFGGAPTIITAAGAVDPSVRVIAFNSATALTASVPAGYRDGQPLTLKNVGSASVTLSLTIDGTTSTNTNLGSLAVLNLIWPAALATWLSC